MTSIRKLHFPRRLAASRLSDIYRSVEEAFNAHDYIYTARYADEPELRGCALLMLGNRVGGEGVLNKNNISTPRSCFYRAYAAWQDDDIAEAQRWIKEARRIGAADVRLDRLTALVAQQSFRVVFHADIHNPRFLKAFCDLPGVETLVTRQLPGVGALMLPFGQTLSSVLPQGFAPDLVLLDDLKLVPVGIGDVGAPVVAMIHDTEWYYNLLPHVLPDIDLLSAGSTSEVYEVGRVFNAQAATYFYPLHLSLPESTPLAELLADVSSRRVDLFYSGSLGHDFYRNKKQSVMALAQIDEKFDVKIEDKFYPQDAFWQEMRQSRFSFMSSRYCNYISSRAIESLVCGTLHLTEEEDGTPYLFSERFDCFSIYRHDHVVVDVEKHLNNYDALIHGFSSQLPRFEAELRSFVPVSNQRRALRFLRYALFMTHIEHQRCKPKTAEIRRDAVFLNEYDRLNRCSPALVSRFLEQTPSSIPLRRVFGQRSLLLAEGKSEEEATQHLLNTLLAARSDSLVAHHVMGLCRMLLGQLDEAEKNFSKIVEGNLRLDFSEPLPIGFGNLNSFYWVADALIRERCATPLASVKDVWISYAWANRADIALRYAFHHVREHRMNDAGEYFTRAIDFVGHSLKLFLYNEDVFRLYLRAHFGAISCGDQNLTDSYLDAFEAACHNDYSLLHDFAAPSFHLLMESKRVDEAQKLMKDLKRAMKRITFTPQVSTLYDEFIPFLRRHNIPHALLD